MVSEGILILAGVLLALVLAGSCWALYRGLALKQEAADAVIERDRLARRLADSPAQVLVIAPDGRIEVPQRLAEWLALDKGVRSLAELSSSGWGLTAEDAGALQRDVEATRRAARTFTRVVRTRDGSRALRVTGERRGDETMLWFADVSASEQQLAGLRDDAVELNEAFAALSALIEAAPLPIWYRDADLQLAMVNSAYVSAVEARDAASVMTRGLELIEGSGQGGPRAGAMAARDSGQAQARVLPATIGGARRALRLHDVPLPVGGVAGFAIDIEELEQANAREKRFAEAQRAMLDRLSAGVVQFGRDRALIFCNQPFRRMFAMRREWLSDRPEFDRVLERMREAGRVPEVRDFPGWKAERRGWFLATDGAAEENWHLPGGTHLRVVAQPLPDGGLLLIFEDRTEQVQLASARDTLLRVRTATFDNLFEALGVFAADGRLQLWNNRFRALWNFEEEFLAGHPRVDAIAERLAPQLANQARSALVPELVRYATVERKQRGGRVALADGRHFEFAAVPLPDGNALVTMLDISDSRRIEQALRDRNEALEAADRVKTAFVANMSYELRTPLTSISGFAEMLHGGYAGNLSGEAIAYVDAILDSVERLGVLIDDVLDLTQADSATLEREDVDLGAVVRAAADALTASARRHRIEFVVEVQRTAGRIHADRRRIREAVEHLLRHAVGATRAGGRVLLHVDGNSKRARIVVSDDGAGMTADEAARAFDRFAQPGITPGQERALGLGLPLAKQFVEAHGGTISLVSEPGQGSLVTVELPRR
ncbi:PAS/PAC sensor signal transduction histidine kinase [Sphingomonas palmae]|uniref:histidine kinase n=1 Tax=Sphingomonas palmae TaxID=1855283 RepID=A0A1H7I8G6_9SPHN|nr:PAS domain-containing sensor histidine kinase [Sphingomonas palmae]SEK58132.1 PAS/PAC sensor signal transduction histidine kinase [Sphingomonas palmae]